MATTSAGLLPYRAGRGLAGRPADGVQVLLGHMGGPFWARKDAGAWSIFKGEYTADEDALAAAKREFTEETGFAPPAGSPYLPLGEIRQRGGKTVAAWAVQADFDAGDVVSNTFEVEWPPRSGRRASFPEIDRAEWFDLAAARAKLVSAQTPLLDRLAALLSEASAPEDS